MKTVLKWAGNKSRLMPQISTHFPHEFKAYVEPFAGAMGSFLNFDNLSDDTPVYLNDLNAELIELFETLKTHPELVVNVANSWARDSKTFYKIRAWDRDNILPTKSSIERAARTIYINKLCFNGLYRVNKKGYFNAPYGAERTTDLITVAGANAVADKLANATLTSFDYKRLLLSIPSGSLVYIDPPYISKKDPNIPYSGYFGNFTLSDQSELRDIAYELYENGHSVFVSNSWCDTSLELYDDFEIREIHSSTSIAARGSGRGKTKEMLAFLIPEKEDEST